MANNNWTLKLCDENGAELHLFQFDPVPLILSEQSMSNLLEGVRGEIEKATAEVAGLGEGDA